MCNFYHIALVCTFLALLDCNNYYYADTNNYYNQGYPLGYSNGRTQGQADVTSAPNNYSIYTKAQYDANYSSGRTQGQSDVTSAPNSYGLYTKAQYDAKSSSKTVSVSLSTGLYNYGDGTCALYLHVGGYSWSLGHRDWGGNDDIRNIASNFGTKTITIN